MRGWLLDENLPRLAPQGRLTVIHVTEIGERLSDTELWDYALSNDLVIVTKDTISITV